MTQNDNAEDILAIAATWKAAGEDVAIATVVETWGCLLYTSPSPRDVEESRMPSSA